MKRRKLLSLSLATVVFLLCGLLSAGAFSRILPKTPFFRTDFKPLSFLEIV